MPTGRTKHFTSAQARIERDRDHARALLRLDPHDHIALAFGTGIAQRLAHVRRRRDHLAADVDNDVAGRKPMAAATPSGSTSAMTTPSAFAGRQREAEPRHIAALSEAITEFAALTATVAALIVRSPRVIAHLARSPRSSLAIVTFGTTLQIRIAIAAAAHVGSARLVAATSRHVRQFAERDRQVLFRALVQDHELDGGARRHSHQCAWRGRASP